EEGRVEGRVAEVLHRPMRGIDLEAPRQVGRLAEELLVPPVAEPADALSDEQPRCDAVHEQPDVRAGTLGHDSADEHAEGDAAPDAEPTPPDREGPPPGIGHLVPARGQVVQAGADDAARNAPHREPEDEIPVAATRHPTASGDPDAAGDAAE